MDLNTILPLLIGGMRGWQFIVIVLLILLLFGGKKIPELMKGLGKGVQSFKQGLAEAKKEINEPVETDKKKPSESKEDTAEAKDIDR